MKNKSLAEKRMLEALGLTEEKEKVEAKKQKAKSSKIQGVSEEEIQEFRAAQAVVYFLQAPELFTPKVCKHCEAVFVVSRRDVAFCSYTCIKASLKELGIEWRRGIALEVAIEEAIKHVYDGNEPLWIKNVDRLRKVLNKLSSETTSNKEPPTTIKENSVIVSVPSMVPVSSLPNSPSSEPSKPGTGLRVTRSKRTFT